MKRKAEGSADLTAEQLDERARNKFFSADYIGALEDLTRVLELKPEASAFLNRGMVRKALGPFATGAP